MTDTKKIFQLIFFNFLLFTFVFGRTFMGLYILNFRIGELLVALSMLFSTYLILNRNKIIIQFGRVHFYLHILIIISFLISSFLSDSLFFTSYTYKSSSYIWAISAIYFGKFYFDDFKITKNLTILLQLALILGYVLSIVYYPQLLIGFFNNYSDKWDFLKASSIALVFFISVLINNNKNYFGRFTYEYFLFCIFLFTPFFLYKSRGAFIAFIFLVVVELIKYRKVIFTFDIRFLIILIISFSLFGISTLTVLNQDPVELAEDNQLIEIFYSGDAVKKLKNQKDTKVESFFSFYTNNGRLYSIDGNINWRMQIWQDVYFDLVNDDKLFFGNGYKDKIPAMEKFERQGRDGSNENVHNFVFNILARGGLVQLVLFIFLFINLFKQVLSRNWNKSSLQLMLAVFIVSSFDASMENAHFPIIFYMFFYYFLNDKTNN